MEEYLIIKVPGFTHHCYGSNYLKTLLDNISEKDVIALEGFKEFKEIYLDFINETISFTDLEKQYIQGIEAIDPYIRETVTEPGIPNVFEFILKNLRGKKFLALEMLENYNNSRDLTNRNILMFNNLGNIINNYYQAANSIISLTAFGHRIDLMGNIEKNNKLDLLRYTKLVFNKKIVIEEESDSFELIFSRNLAN